MSVVQNGDFQQVDYRDMKLGAPLGGERVIECPQCKRHGVRWRETKTVAHIVLYRRKAATHKEETKLVLSCKGVLPKEVITPPRNLGFPWCPKEMF